MAIHKSTLAKVALKSLNDLHEMIEENRRERGNQDAGACAIYHAHSAANYIKAIRAVDASLPAWLTRDWAWYKSIGWHNERIA